ncbi:MAG: phosphocholine cytidylyltransferase family protein [Candidatus Poribacteria bacterium]|nr:phosphocholine cytidylyltransferase family protein [Candidatus Poribacteria bacterium]
MKAIIIGAGRGVRLMPTTANTPKCFAEVNNRRILDWGLQAFADNDIEHICFIGGYAIEKVRRDYPQFVFYHNANWENNNILASLMCAEPEMEESFFCCYSDILFKPDIVTDLIASDGDISLAVDTRWLERYTHRTEHPTDDAEKVTVLDGVVTQIHREIPEKEAHGEFIGVAKFSTEGEHLLREHYHRSRQRYGDKPYREAPSFRKAYLIHLFQEMIEEGVEMQHVDCAGGYMEIDTQQDLELARKLWR